MAHLTVKEKEHWKERINRKVDQAIDALLAASDSRYMERITKQAREMAIQSLGIEDLHAQAEALEKQEEEARDQRHQLYKAMVAQLTDRSSQDHTVWHGQPHVVRKAIDKRQRLHEQQLLERDELGRQILTLRREQEELLDTVWLATSCKQIRQLWNQVAELLQQSPTQLQAAALTIEPESDPS